MKLKNRIMSWILSPGAYALWHSMGNPEEWEEIKDNHTWYLRHKPSTMCMLYGRGCMYGFRGFFLDGSHRYGVGHCIGYFERHLVYPRVRACLKRIRYMQRTSDFRKANTNLLSKLTINQVAE